MDIRLTKTGDSSEIRLDKAPRDEIVINLNWSRTSGDLDLDLGCYWEETLPPREPGILGWVRSVFAKPRRGCIDGLQFAHGQGGPRTTISPQGCYTQAPWVWHAGDDRVGTSASGENLLLNPAAAAHLKRIVLYAFIYEGAPRWSATDATVRIAVPGQAPVVIELGKQDATLPFCALATIDFDGATGMRVTRHVTFHDGHASCASAWGWEMTFVAGTKE
jgi:tellurite resistance protein TerA